MSLWRAFSQLDFKGCESQAVYRVSVHAVTFALLSHSHSLCDRASLSKHNSVVDEHTTQADGNTNLLRTYIRTDLVLNKNEILLFGRRERALRRLSCGQDGSLMQAMRGLRLNIGIARRWRRWQMRCACRRSRRDVSCWQLASHGSTKFYINLGSP